MEVRVARSVTHTKSVTQMNSKRKPSDVRRLFGSRAATSDEIDTSLFARWPAAELFRHDMSNEQARRRVGRLWCFQWRLSLDHSHIFSIHKDPQMIFYGINIILTLIMLVLTLTKRRILE